MMHRRSLAAAVLVLVSWSCSGDDGAERRSDQAYVDRVAATFGTSDDPNAIDYSSEDRACIAPRVVDKVGTARLDELGADPTDGSDPNLWLGRLSDDERAAVGAILEACVQLSVAMADLLSESGVDRAAAECVARRYVDSGLATEALLTPDFDPALNERIDVVLADAYAQCDASRPTA